MIRVIILLSFLISKLTFADINPVTLTPERSSDKVQVIKGPSKEEIKEASELHEKLRHPQSTMRTFMQAMDKVKNGNSSAFKEAIQTLDLSLIDPPLRELTGKITAERLVNTIDRIAKINYAHIPNYESGPKWFFRKQSVTVGENVYDVEIAIGKTAEGDWKFTPETVSSIENFYSSVAHQKVIHGITEYRNWRTHFKESMPGWTSEEFLLFKKGQWLGLFALLLISLAFFAFVRFLITRYLHFKVKRKSLDMEEGEQFKSTLAFGCLAFSVSWLIGIRQLELDVEMLEVFVRGAYILTAFSSVWSALKLVDYVSLHFEREAKITENKFDDVLVPMLKKTSKVIVVAFGVILIAHSLTFDIASILAGLGIGGVAVALAAKDTISNLFGSVTVIIDRPFQIGDYVVLEKGLEGAVEEVGFRSTRIRTPSNSLVTLPNSVLANMAIDNYGMR
ncbi:MAG: mechanosensitive ion channel family protein, partial [Bacteriovorax sp.]